MAFHNKSLGELLAALHKEFGEFHYGRVDIDVTSAQKQKAIAHFSDPKVTKFSDWSITHRENKDGIKLYLADKGWLLIRASGTENLLRLYSETNNAATTQKVLQAITAMVRKL